MSESARENSIRSVMFIFRENPPAAIAALKHVAARAKTQVEAFRMESCAQDAVKFCSGRWKDRCEKAADQIDESN